jgi:predicted RNA-binding protein with PUA-like domain
MVATRGSKRGGGGGAGGTGDAPPAAAPTAPAKRAKVALPGKRAKVAEPRKRAEAAAAAPAPAPGSEGGPQYWLFKSEPESRVEQGVEMKFGIDDLERCVDKTEPWDGVRNHEAKQNMLRMRVGDLGLFYHSNCRTARPHVAGVVRVARAAYPDHTAWTAGAAHFDARGSEVAPRWFMVDVQLVRKFARPVTLDDMRAAPALREMALLKRPRLSVVGVAAHEWRVVCAMGDGPAA